MLNNILSFTIKLTEIILILISPFVLSGFIFYIIKIFKGYRVPKSEFGTYHHLTHGSFLKRLFYDFPKAFINDLFSKNPDFFKPYGVHLIAGKQGCGKTVTIVYLLMKYAEMYPKMQVKTNFNYRYENGTINHWKDLINSNNGIYGEIDVIDEVQNWFSSMQSKDFPPEMLTEITQQRKQRKMIMCTSQVFGRVSKPIREQVFYLYEPITLFGCLTIVKKVEPIISAVDGLADKKKFKGLFFFVHTKKLRECYDTYKKVEKLSKGGFIPRVINEIK